MSSVKLLFEIGHSAERKAKPSKHGFTHVRMKAKIDEI